MNNQQLLEELFGKDPRPITLLAACLNIRQLMEAILEQLPRDAHLLKMRQVETLVEYALRYPTRSEIQNLAKEVVGKRISNEKEIRGLMQKFPATRYSWTILGGAVAKFATGKDIVVFALTSNSPEVQARLAHLLQDKETPASSLVKLFEEARVRRAQERVLSIFREKRLNPSGLKRFGRKPGFVRDIADLNRDWKAGKVTT